MVDIRTRGERGCAVRCNYLEQMWFHMGRKTLIALWISACTVAGLQVKHYGRAKVRQYRSVPQGVYANAAPYGSFSFQTPTVTGTQSTTPVEKQETKNELKDSYGNTIQSLPSFPQHFFQLTAAPSYYFPQGLPTPWPWPSPLTRFGPFTPSFVSEDSKNGTQWDWSQFNTPQSSNSNHWNQLDTTKETDGNFWNQFETTKESDGNFWNQFETTKDPNSYYWNQLKTTNTQVPNNNYRNQLKTTNAQGSISNYWNQFDTTKDSIDDYWNQFETTKDSNSNYWNQHEKTNAQDSNRKLVYATQGLNWLRQPKYQWLDNKPRYQEYHDYYERPRYRTPHSLKEKVQAPIKHTVKTNYNGKDIVVQLETKPPLPLVDLRLLEPVKTDGTSV